MPIMRKKISEVPAISGLNRKRPAARTTRRAKSEITKTELPSTDKNNELTPPLTECAKL
jgi:hypothetical protein